MKARWVPVVDDEDDKSIDNALIKKMCQEKQYLVLWCNPRWTNNCDVLQTCARLDFSIIYMNNIK